MKELSELLAKIDVILKGIDEQQTDDAWWETSTGVEFGIGKRDEVKAAIIEFFERGQ